MTALQALAWGATAVGAFHLAFWRPGLSPFIVVFLLCLTQLIRMETPRGAFYSGLAVGLCCYGPQTRFLWNIFTIGAPALWFVLAFWLGLYVALGRLCLRQLGPAVTAFLLPALWCGIEYFRSELYPLRFTWLSVGYAFSGTPQMCCFLGVYGMGLALMLTVGVAWSLPWRGGLIVLVAVVSALFLEVRRQGAAAVESTGIGRPIRVAGIQVEVPTEEELIQALDRLIEKHPEAELILLAEYTFQSPPPESVRAWCRRARKYLVAGGKDPINDSEFYNTAFVVDPTGEMVFRQAKSVPIQFFRDGRPAAQQALWDSPWGKLGVCICYDLSYRRVVDPLIRLGAQAVLVPTMDELAWGRQEHEHHARVAPLRAAETGLAMFRVGSCGIPQLVDPAGNTLASAPFPGQAAMVAGQLQLVEHGRLPWDHWLAPACSLTSALLCLCFAAADIRQRFSGLTKSRRRESAVQPRLPDPL